MASRLNAGVPAAQAVAARVPGLDLLRAIAIVWVMLYHVVSFGIKLPGFVDYGWIGVDLFFVLSGYLIAWPLMRDYASGTTPAWRRFMLRRAFRVLPAYLVVLALYEALPSIREGEGVAPLWEFLTFTLNLFPDYATHTTFSHAWSLCVEEQFYLALPPILWLLARRTGRVKAVLALLAILVGGMLLRGWLWQTQVGPLLGAKAGTGDAMARYVETIYNPTYTRLDGLLAGVVLAAIRAFRPHWWRSMMARAPLFLLFGVVAFVAALRLFGSPNSIAYIGAVYGYPLLSIALASLLVAAASPQTVLGRGAIPGVAPIATMAFSLYLTHKAVFRVLQSTFGARPEQHNLLVFCLYIAMALAVGAVLYFAVERPGLRLRERLPAALSRRRAVAIEGTR